MVPLSFEWILKGAEVSQVDFSIWVWRDKMLREMKKSKIINTEAELRTALPQIRGRLPQRLIDDAIAHV